MDPTRASRQTDIDIQDDKDRGCLENYDDSSGKVGSVQDATELSGILDVQGTDIVDTCSSYVKTGTKRYFRNEKKNADEKNKWRRGRGSKQNTTTKKRVRHE